MNADSIIEDLQEMLEEGNITQEEYDVEMAKLQPRPPEDHSHKIEAGDRVVLSSRRVIDILRIDKSGEIWFGWEDMVCHVSPHSLRGMRVIKAVRE